MILEQFKKDLKKSGIKSGDKFILKRFNIKLN